MRNSITTVFVCLLAWVLVSPRAGAQVTLRDDTDVWDCGKWTGSVFAKGTVPPFSFTYGGVPSAKLLPRWRFSKTVLESGRTDESLISYTWTDPGSGFQVEARVKRFSDWNAAEWVLLFRNTGKKDTPQIASVRTVDLTQPAGEEVFFADGPYFSAADFRSRDTLLSPGQTLHLEPDGGRSSSHTMPYFNVRTPSGGIVYGIGWTGSWSADISCTSGYAAMYPRRGSRSAIYSQQAASCRVSAGLRDFDSYLRPGEEIRAASVFMVPWQGEDRMDGQNRMRRFILAHHHPEASGQPVKAPILSSFDHNGPWPCDEFACLTAFQAEATIRQYQFYGTQADAFWLDAGWYDRAADYMNGYWWHSAVGNWTPDPRRFPDGIAPIADAAHAAGCKLLLWYEPERANVDSDWAHAHPEWMLAASGAPAVPLDEPVDSAFIVNLGNPQALEWVCGEIVKSLTENKIDIYRQDFNIMPEPFWLNNDEPGRRGMTEVKYIAGLYSYLDFLHTQLPYLIIDNCAGGGRRLDFEMVSRGIALWRSDYSNYIDGLQCHGYYLNQWLPVHCTCVASGDPYDYRSTLGAGVNFTWGTRSRNGLSIEGEKALIRLYRGLKDYFLEDFYPLSGYGDITGDDQWLAYQLDRPSDGTGIVVAFRRSASPDSVYAVALRGLDPDAEYVLRFDPDVAAPGREIRLGHKPDTASLSSLPAATGNLMTVKGRTLSEGLALTLPEPRTSLLLRYSKQ